MLWTPYHELLVILNTTTAYFQVNGIPETQRCEPWNSKCGIWKSKLEFEISANDTVFEKHQSQNNILITFALR